MFTGITLGSDYEGKNLARRTVNASEFLLSSPSKDMECIFYDGKLNDFSVAVNMLRKSEYA